MTTKALFSPGLENPNSVLKQQKNSVISIYQKVQFI